MEVVQLRHNMYIRGVRLWDFSHLDWQKLNIEQYVSFTTALVSKLAVEPTTLLPFVRPTMTSAV